ncbi:tRNA threonylcarbamoyladenosine biosynthesis protein TsaB [Rubripirellula tenax]|uniref:tRNA threonylcarbamoyladenosine biosynthesis protein TsaB n=1 Tax=Rubripirellula tenax TaxID=2528015 RepID=A0A5C6EBW1_9BACT|nr:tRNA (adenosine(37)-N6)-threonylcarbamoyltransferase complex dimerization subunit type 1 TsaB [Rubripirellula tenax]TWU46378.1 tRNA threonylcarbamoyladenosine biosynthesis protein TsaB [Rubripirellula tenax]
MNDNPTSGDPRASSRGAQHSLQLAIETTSRAGSVALFLKDRVLDSVSLDPSQRSAATLTTVIGSILEGVKSSGQSIDFVSVASGPGSFTGLRIGVTTAKSLCYALGIPLVSVDSLAAIAAARFHADPELGEVLVALDAFRGQVFEGRFTRRMLLPSATSDLNDWSAIPDCVGVRSLSEFRSDLPTAVGSDNTPLALAGDAKPFGDAEDRRLEGTCDAIGVGILGNLAAARGDFTDPMILVPRYLKASSAEEKAAEAPGT